MLREVCHRKRVKKSTEKSLCETQMIFLLFLLKSFRIWSCCVENKELPFSRMTREHWNRSVHFFVINGIYEKSLKGSIQYVLILLGSRNQWLWSFHRQNKKGVKSSFSSEKISSLLIALGTMIQRSDCGWFSSMFPQKILQSKQMFICVERFISHCY